MDVRSYAQRLTFRQIRRLNINFFILKNKKFSSVRSPGLRLQQQEALAMVKRRLQAFSLALSLSFLNCSTKTCASRALEEGGSATVKQLCA
ncbi:MAG: hypothetical protein F6K31_36450 [Symploca sp. SIO2G7]|nr:hypothetical protein [Symploca sp. SIO2G7]